MSLFMDRIHLGIMWAAFLPCAIRLLPPNRVRWPILGPDCVPWSETEDWMYLGPDGPNGDSDGTFSACQPPLLVVSTPQKAPVDVILACQMPVWPRFGVFWATHAHQKWVQNGSNLFFLQK